MKNLAGKGKEIAIGAVILIVITGVFYFFKNRTKPLTVPVSTGPSIQTVEQNLKNKFNLTVPDNVEKAVLKDVSGGSGQGIATRTEILADLPDPEAGKFYQAWLENAAAKRILLGALRVAKGGYLIEYNGANYPGYNKVIITLDSKTILEGSF